MANCKCYAGFALALLVLFLSGPSLAQTTCTKSFTVNNSNKLFSSCRTLKQLGANFAWTYDPVKGAISMAFTATPGTSGGWVSWGINPLAPAMAGTQSLIAFKHSNGSILVNTYNVTGANKMASDPLNPSAIDYKVEDMMAEFKKNQITIFATWILKNNKTTVNHVWQTGSQVKGLVPKSHEFNLANLQSLGSIDLKTGVASVSPGIPHLVLKNTHGVLNVVGWSIILPIGVMFPRMVTMASSSLQRLPAINLIPTHARVRTALLPSAQSRRLALLHFGSGFHQARMFGIRTSNNMMVEGNMTQAGAMVSQENLQEWSKKDNRRLLHVVYRVGDLEKTIKFYTECLGMKLLRKRDIPEERYTNAFLGFGPEESHFVVELTYNYGVDSYNLGTGFGHFGIAVEDVYKAVDLIKAKGGKISREPGPVKGGKSVIAFVEDPDGYKFELIERGPTPEPLCQVMLRVGDLERAIEFYEKAYGMELLRKRDNPDYEYTIAMMGYGPEDKSTVLELTYNYGVKEYDKGSAYAQIAISTDDVYKTAEAVRLAGGKITREPGPLPGLSTKITACLDPDGWKTVFVDNADFLKEFEL